MEEQNSTIFKNCRLFDPFTNKVYDDTSFIVNDTTGRVLSVFFSTDDYDPSLFKGKHVDIGGKIVIPAFIDAHMHCESVLVTPSKTSFIAEHGTAVCIADPHEIVNVLGEKGFWFFVDDSKDAIIDFRFSIPSCVPATPFETSGGIVNGETIEKIMKEEIKRRVNGKKKVINLGEVMNVDGVVNESDYLMDILNQAKRFELNIDGHAPGVKGERLNKYINMGVMNDHECQTEKELDDRIKRGMYVLIREGTAGKNAYELCKALSKYSSIATKRCSFCTDDRRIDDIYKEGHIDNAVRIGIKAGLDPKDAIRMGTLNPAEMFHLDKDYGSITPGKYGSFCVLDGELKDVKINQVYIH